MRKLIVVIAGAVALTGLGTAGAAERLVSITRTGFVPSDVTIAAGDTVTWRNADTQAHRVVFDRAPCNLTIAPGASGSCTFRSAGKFNYRDPSQGGNFRGTVTVTGAQRTVTLSASRNTVRYGGSVTLSGAVSSQQAGEAVTVTAQECGKPAFTRLDAATTTAGGNWALTVKPTINTTYQVRWRTAESATTLVKVMPAIRLTRSGGRFTVRVTAAQAFTGKLVTFQRYRAVVRRWVTVKRATLRSATTPSAGTMVTSTRFRARVRRGWRVRVFLPQSQAGTCYRAAPSNTLRIR